MRFIFKNKGKPQMTIGVVKLFLDPADLEALKKEFKIPTMEDMMGGLDAIGGPPPGDCPM